MKKVIKYQSELSGEVFDTAEECKAHDFRRIKENLIYDELGRNPDPEQIFDFIVEHTKGFKDAP